jgi:hypothetical protein
MLSYYSHLRNYNAIPERMSLSEMIADKKFGIAAWHSHTRSWLEKTQDGHIIQIFHYEKLLADTAGELARFFDLLGIQISAANLDKAIEASSKSNMQRSDARHFSTQLLKQRQSGFVRGHKSQTLSEQDIDYIKRVTGDVCQELGL